MPAASAAAAAAALQQQHLETNSMQQLSETLLRALCWFLLWAPVARMEGAVQPVPCQPYFAAAGMGSKPVVESVRFHDKVMLLYRTR
jgi:hypothetical protein